LWLEKRGEKPKSKPIYGRWPSDYLTTLFSLNTAQVVAIVDENRIEECFAAHSVHSCQQY
jgi:hypothetical protein